MENLLQKIFAELKSLKEGQQSLGENFTSGLKEVNNRLDLDFKEVNNRLDIVANQTFDNSIQLSKITDSLDTFSVIVKEQIENIDNRVKKLEQKIG